MNAPEPNEYATMQAGYVKLASNYGDVIELLNKLKDSTYQFFMQLPAEKGDYAYAEGKWTVKQALNHMIDTERIFAYRLLCFARGETQKMPGFDQNAYEETSHSNSRTLESLADEFKTVRAGNLYLINNLTPEEIAVRGNATGYTITIRALLYTMAGHELHHLNVLRERYL
ncbi:DinB family protein [Mucilaginibacter polytrichastri]|uniref:DinB-like domain-containing protein n=1 Tax=Mucilaginibacter polytrichastri TaxID=1302689 RepID=A0A1Q6A3W2_9SPHI|nr:DinB family protein [Mucilaginibacter polytrichastri]OKS88690.1 hypothetical protein RG47T_4168 [Mucilaginibacter polytrichastri]SFT04468.1 DinB superfamily protein [Mucilaginibacter polytrichastri]